MRLSDRTVLFDFHGIPVIGSWQTGNVIGLTAQGLAACQAMAEGDVDRAVADDADPALADALERGGFLAGCAPAPKAAKSAYVHVTQRCNLECAGCYSVGPARNRIADPGLDQLRRAFDLLAGWGTRAVSISGGEPFLRADLPEVCRSAKEAGIERITVLSNGTAVTAGALERLAPWVDCVSISFDGASADAPAPIRGRQLFDRLCQAVRAVRDAGIPAHMIATVHRGNVGDMEAYVHLAAELGASLNFSLLTCRDDQPGVEGLTHTRESLQRMGETLLALGEVLPQGALDAPLSVSLCVRERCGAGTSTVSVDADGTVYPCHMMHDPSMAMGNAFEDDGDAVFSSPAAEQLRSWTALGSEACGQCRYAPLCGGGCRARALHGAGSLEAADPFCAMTKRFYGLLGESLRRRFFPAPEAS